MKNIIQQAREVIFTNVNTVMSQTYWSIGKRIVEEEQNGNYKAEYGSRLLKEISKELTNECGRGFSRSNLHYMRKFFPECQNARHCLAN